MPGIILSNGLIKSPFALLCPYIKGSKVEINGPFLFKVRKTARIRNPFNQVSHLFQDTKLENNKITINITNKSQEVSTLPSDDHKAAMNRRESMTNTIHN